MFLFIVNNHPLKDKFHVSQETRLSCALGAKPALTHSGACAPLAPTGECLSGMRTQKPESEHRGKLATQCFASLRFNLEAFDFHLALPSTALNEWFFNSRPACLRLGRFCLFPPGGSSHALFRIAPSFKHHFSLGSGVLRCHF